jgi:hypothetical protein
MLTVYGYEDYYLYHIFILFAGMKVYFKFWLQYRKEMCNRFSNLTFVFTVRNTTQKYVQRKICKKSLLQLSTFIINLLVIRMLMWTTANSFRSLWENCKIPSFIQINLFYSHIRSVGLMVVTKDSIIGIHV